MLNSYMISIRTLTRRAAAHRFAKLSIIILLIISTTVVVERYIVFQTHASSSIFYPPDGQGLFEECRIYNSSCLADLKKIAGGGFKLVLNYNSLIRSSAQQLIAYANQARADKIKLIWPMNGPWFWDGTDLRSYYPVLASTCACTDNTSFIRYFINLVKNHAATWGYYVGDELHASVHAQWKTFATLVHQADPRHPRLFIAGTLANAHSNPDLLTFADGDEVVGQDFYPIGVHYLVPYTQTGAVAHAAQSLADRARRQSAMVLQAFSWQQDYPPARCMPYPQCAPYPTKDQMHQMLIMTLQNAHPRLVLWYSYFDIINSDNPERHWRDLVNAARI